MAPACAARNKGAAPTGHNSFGQGTRYIQKAVRSSSEGVIILPSKRAENLFDLARLNEIAQALRPPAAACFVNRAIDTMKRGKRDGEDAYVDVPEGQVKIRTRLSPDGEVLRTEVLDTGFKDPEIEPCIMEAIQARKWIKNRSGVVQYLDVIYWVSLGDGSEDKSPEAKAELRRQQAMVAIRGKGCLERRVGAGTYPVEGLNLVDRDGNTLVSRVEPSSLPQKVQDCLSVVLREIQMPRAPGSFVRPISPQVEYTVATDGTVSFADERWINLILMEEKAAREDRLAEVDRGLGIAEPKPEPTIETTEPPAGEEPASEPETPAQDPGQGGIKLKLGGHRRAGSPR
ncbi:hypothetical protein [Nannocystis bainbridge]|uniref:TonB C-terminal domain-containing protein n=1 Tax=Nannocystis bainbridge TaxID=2995303 RepID=A0ABT5EA75_9BACT|nr:hypothetical protein [Nannocystis bainbridge]MDC0722749.1 hypothetical protein [Nannocystis bainbridge]